MKFDDLLSRPRISEALGFAIAKHGNQKYGDLPYQDHLLAVARVVYAHMPTMGEIETDVVIQSAILHDVLEDTEATPTEIFNRYGPNVLAIVDACTKKDDDLCRSCAFKRTVNALKSVPYAKLVKMADRLVNMQTSLANRSSHLNMYVREYREFRAWLQEPGDPPELWKLLDEVYTAGERKKK